jgi:hypothetical protein
MSGTSSGRSDGMKESQPDIAIPMPKRYFARASNGLNAWRQIQAGGRGRKCCVFGVQPVARLQRCRSAICLWKQTVAGGGGSASFFSWLLIMPGTAFGWAFCGAAFGCLCRSMSVEAPSRDISEFGAPSRSSKNQQAASSLRFKTQ